MSMITLNNTDIQTTSLGFGCGGLMRVTSARQRQRLLSEAFDAGIRHFDVAPIYGLGKAETEVGKFARGRREQLVLATKFGLQVKRASEFASTMQVIGRRVLAMIPALRRAVRKHSNMLYAPKNFDVETAKRSLEESLRALRTDYIDIFLLHEPELAQVQDTGVWEYLQRAKEKGLIRAWGVAGYPDQVKPVCDAIPALARVIQIPNDVVNCQQEQFGDYSDAGFITFSPYSGVYDTLRALINNNSAFVDNFMKSTDIDLRQRGVLAKLMVGYCLCANSSGVTLFFSGRSEGIGDNVAAWKSGYSEESVDAFADLVHQVLAR